MRLLFLCLLSGCVEASANIPNITFSQDVDIPGIQVPLSAQFTGSKVIKIDTGSVESYINNIELLKGNITSQSILNKFKITLLPDLVLLEGENDKVFSINPPPNNLKDYIKDKSLSFQIELSGTLDSDSFKVSTSLNFSINADYTIKL